MEIGEEIKQSRFDSEYQKLTVNILFTSSWLNARIMKRLKPYGISPQQYNVLRILRGQHPKPATINLLQERMLDRMSNASRLVEKLRQKGLVERRICERDRRACDVLITAKGLQLLAQLDETEAVWEQELHNLSISEATRLNSLLDKLRG